MDSNATYYEVTEDGTRLSDDKTTSIEFRKGQRISLADASRFGFTKDAGAAAMARPQDEVPDLAPTTLEERGLKAAPENKSAGSAPSTKADKG